MAVLTPRSVFRRYEVDGVPSSGPHKPEKSEIIQLLEQIFGVSRGGWVVTQTLAELNGVTPKNETDGGVVLADPDPANNGYYQRDGDSWERERGFPDTFARLTVTGGTANAVQASAASGVNPGDVGAFLIDIDTPNTGPVTISINGGDYVSALSVDGDDFEPGEFTGRVYLSAEGDGSLRAFTADAGVIAALVQEATSVAPSTWQDLRDETVEARDKSQEWAENPEDEEVEAGEYSALHHSAKASAQRVLAETAATTAVSASELAETFAGVDHRAVSWAGLAAINGTAGQIGYVPDEDTGTHTDPITSETTPNAGVYRWDDDGLGSAQAERIGNTGTGAVSPQSTTPQFIHTQLRRGDDGLLFVEYAIRSNGKFEDYRYALEDSEPTPDAENDLTPQSYPVSIGINNHLPDCHWSNAWVTNFIETEKETYLSSVSSYRAGRPAEILLNERLTLSDTWNRVQIGTDPNMYGDNHNYPGLCVDPHSAADVPLIAVTGRHPGAYRIWRGASVTARNMGKVNPFPFGAGGTYAAVYRRPTVPDEIWVVGRVSTGNWRIVRSLDGGETWESPVSIFSMANNIYPLMRPRQNGEGLFVICRPHPSYVGGPIVSMLLDWDGELRDLSGVSIDNIWDAEYSAVDPEAVGDVLIEAPTETTRLELTSAREIDTDVWGFSWVQWAAAYYPTATRIWYAEVDYSGETPEVATPIDVCDGGTPLRSGGPYMAGAAVIGAGMLLCARWNPSGASDTGLLSVFDVTGVSPLEVTPRIAETPDIKIGKPIDSIRVTANESTHELTYSPGTQVAWWQGTMTDFTDYKTDGYVANIEDILS